MKKLLFLGIVALMVQSLGAVTLPSTSYGNYASSTPSTSESFITSGGVVVTGSYSVLGEGDVWCKDVTPLDACEGCCANTFSSCISQCGDDDACLDNCETMNNECIDNCEGGGSLPLDGGLSILLLLSVAGGMVKAYRVKEL